MQQKSRCTNHLLGVFAVVQLLVDLLEHEYITNSESGLLVPQLMSQLVTLHELLNDLVYDCTDMCEILFMFAEYIDVHTDL